MYCIFVECEFEKSDRIIFIFSLPHSHAHALCLALAPLHAIIAFIALKQSEGTARKMREMGNGALEKERTLAICSIEMQSVLLLLSSEAESMHTHTSYTMKLVWI